jgi:hypothetical protein
VKCECLIAVAVALRFTFHVLRFTYHAKEAPINPQLTDLESSLNSFDLTTRTAALAELVGLAERGRVQCEPEQPVVNMHCHTFFSFNAYGHSPASLAWLAKKRGFRAIGIVDFDVLDCVEEFLGACDVAGLRGSAGVETRVFIPEFADREINSPGEPGVFYHMGIGFTSGTAPDAAAGLLDGMRSRAARRNRDMMVRVNEYLAPVTIDFERDVLPLTPAGNATERHMLVAYVRAAETAFSDSRDAELGGDLGIRGNLQDTPLVDFWAGKLGMRRDEVARTMGDRVAFQNLLRARLMKKGGVGYVKPTPDSFPTVEEFHRMILPCGALPCATWLDGLSPGEQDIDELLELLIAKGIVALNIIPDRNWNLADPDMRRLKAGKLHEIVEKAAQYALPLNIGTEMNAPGNKLVDDFDAPELVPLRRPFLDGAHFIYGHTVMQRALGLGYGSAWAQGHLPARPDRNAFYTAIGRRVPPGARGMKQLRRLDPALSPSEVLAHLDPAS